MVRKGLDPDYYHPDSQVPFFYRIHIGKKFSPLSSLSIADPILSP
jgi:hypothetical protein